MERVVRRQRKAEGHMRRFCTLIFYGLIVLLMTSCASFTERNAFWGVKEYATSLPVGVWSMPIKIPEYCGFMHKPEMCGTEFAFKYRYLDSEWQEHVHGKDTDLTASEVQFIILRAGLDTPPLTPFCR